MHTAGRDVRMCCVWFAYIAVGANSAKNYIARRVVMHAHMHFSICCWRYRFAEYVYVVRRDLTQSEIAARFFHYGGITIWVAKSGEAHPSGQTTTPHAPRPQNVSW